MNADSMDLAYALKQINKTPVSALMELRNKMDFALDPKVNVLNPCTPNVQQEVIYTVVYADGRKFEGSGVAKSKSEASHIAALNVMCNMSITISDLNQKKKKLQVVSENLPSASSSTRSTVSIGKEALSCPKVDVQDTLSEHSVTSIAETSSAVSSSSSNSECDLQPDLLVSLERAVQQCGKSALSYLNELCAKHRTATTEIAVVIDALKPEHELTLSVLFNGVHYTGSGVDRKKQDAKQKAAVKLLHVMSVTPEEILRSKTSCKSKISSSVQRIDDTDTKPTVATPDTSSSTNCKDGDLDQADAVGQKPGEGELIPTTEPSNSSTESDPPLQHTVSNEQIPMASRCMSELRKLCGEKGFSPPVFIKIKEEGPDHCKTFEVKCSVKSKHGGLETIGVDGKRVKAERNAAMQMIEKLKVAADDVSHETVKESLSLVNVDEKMGAQPSESECKNPDCRNLISHESHQFKNISQSSLTLLRDYNEPVPESDCWDPLSILTQIAGNERFEIKYLDANLPFSDDDWQWLSCCYFIYRGGLTGDITPSGFLGSAKTVESAQSNAAAKALQFLKYITEAEKETKK